MPVQSGVALIVREIGREARSWVAWVAARPRRHSTAAPPALARDERVGRDLCGGAALADDGGALAGRVERRDDPSAKMLTGLDGAHAAEKSQLIRQPSLRPLRCAGSRDVSTPQRESFRRRLE